MLFGLMCCAGAVVIYAAMRYDDRRARRKAHLWAGWIRCQGCKGLYPEMSSDTPCFCSSECKEISELERMAKIK